MSSTIIWFFSYKIFFFVFCCLIFWVTISSTILSRRDDSDYPCIISDFSGKVFSFSPLHMLLTLDLPQMSLNWLRLLFSYFLEHNFFINECWTLSNLSAWTEMITWFLLLILSMCHITFTDLCMVDTSLILGIKSTYSGCINILKGGRELCRGACRLLDLIMVTLLDTAISEGNLRGLFSHVSGQEPCPSQLEHKLLSVSTSSLHLLCGCLSPVTENSQLNFGGCSTAQS